MSRPELGATRLARRAGSPQQRGPESVGHEGAKTTPYGRPVLKEPVWTWEIPCYFYTGGLAGASAILAHRAEGQGNPQLARRAWAAALAGAGASPALLISDLGRPARFFNMLRVLKVTSPMSVGTWILSASGVSIALAAVRAWSGLFPRAGRAGSVVAAALGGPLGTYTAALVADTAIPVWHEARHELPFVFAGSAAASAGAIATAWTPAKHAGPARWATVGGAVVEVAGTQLMEHRLGSVGEPYHEGAAGRLGMAAKAMTTAGAAAIALRGRRSRAAALAGAALVTAGSLCERWSVFKAGFQSAARPDDTVVPQRERIERGDTRGAVRRTSPDGRVDPDRASPAIIAHRD
ncbi:MAG TPA: NrfD/PsrC family molybdoenzyme membrane anchor subunit [Solirubrobacteraceae bacterium]|nr:NrfD/PsrC family molybdoenzyme membrane anchor subunit [Solirubrobacteraceae bacterium]